MSERTMGPWHWEDAYDFEPYKGNRDWQSENFKQGRIKLVAADGSTVLEEWASFANDGGLSVKRGDALVIGAAWDLLEALRPLAGLLQPHIDVDERGRERPGSNPVFQVNGAVITVADLRRARDAIAKAEGKV